MIYQTLKGKRFERALVGFGGEPHFAWMRVLKKGFYHCLVVVGEGSDWLMIDPLAHIIDVVVIKSNDIEGAVQKMGYRTLWCPISEPQKRSFRPVLITCVGVVKRILGVKNCKIMTPYQLFKCFYEEIGK